MSVTSVSDMIFLAAPPFCRLKKVPQPKKKPSGDVPPIFVVIFSINSTVARCIFFVSNLSVTLAVFFQHVNLFLLKRPAFIFFCSVSFTHRKVCHFSHGARVDQLPFCWFFTLVALKTWTCWVGLRMLS